MNLIPAYPAPDFKDIGKWSDGSMHSIKDFKGKAHTIRFLDIYMHLLLKNNSNN